MLFLQLSFNFMISYRLYSSGSLGLAQYLDRQIIDISAVEILWQVCQRNEIHQTLPFHDKTRKGLL